LERVEDLLSRLKRFRLAAHWVRRLPALAAATLLALVLLLYIRFPEWLGSDLTGNLLAEALGIFFTVVFLQWLIDLYEKQRSLPARYAAYQETTRLFHAIGDTWTSIVRSTLSLPPAPETNLFSTPIVDEVLHSFDTNGSAGTYPDQPWRQEIEARAKDWTNRARHIVDRYQSSLDPNFLAALLRFEEIHTFNCWKNLVAMSAAMQAVGGLPNGLLITEDFEEHDVQILVNVQKHLLAMAGEFRGIDGFVKPYDLSFGEGVRLIRERDDIAPKLGACRRSPAGQRIPVGSGPPPRMASSAPI
jgi:hypothetical protein